MKIATSIKKNLSIMTIPTVLLILVSFPLFSGVLAGGPSVQEGTILNLNVETLSGENVQGDELPEEMPKSAASYTIHENISLVGNSEVDAFFAGNDSDGLSWETAHVISGWNVSFVDTHAIHLEDSTKYIIITDCYFLNCSVRFIDLYNCQNVAIENCEFVYTDKWLGYNCANHSSNIIVRNNQATHTLSLALFVNSHDCIFESNDINHVSAGMASYDSVQIIIEKNSIVDCGTFVEFDNCNNSIMQYNSILGSFGSFSDGFDLSSSNLNQIKYNEVNGPYNPINMYNSSHNQVYSCIMNLSLHNSIIADQYCINNSFWGNHFIGEHEYFYLYPFPAIEDEGSNHWDDGTFGNYYNNYTNVHPDAISSDGITWDTPYEVSDGVLDNHPLISPTYILDPIEINIEGSSFVDNESTGNFQVVSISCDDVLVPTCEIRLDGDLINQCSWESGEEFLVPVNNLALGEHEIEVMVDSGILYYGSSETKQFTVTIPCPYQPAITSGNQNLTANSTMIIWDSCRYAENYTVYVNGLPFGTTEGTMMEVEFEYSGTYTITVVAENYVGMSQPSESAQISVTLEEQPDEGSNKLPGWSIGLIVGMGIAMVAGLGYGYVSKKKPVVGSQ